MKHEKGSSQISTGTGLLLIILFCWFYFGYLNEQSGVGSEPENWKSKDNSMMAYIMMEDFVKKRLKSPSTAKFPGVSDGRGNHVKLLGNQTYEINSCVDSQNSFGAMLRAQFTGKIQQTEEYEWKLLSLEVGE